MQRWKPLFGSRIAIGPVSVAPDWYMWLIPYSLTTFATILVIIETHDQWTRCDIVVALVLVTMNQTAAILLLLADPGILPRSLVSSSEMQSVVEVDDVPKTNNGGNRTEFCRHCRVIRPARCHHCYSCGVCVLQHDHHCHIMGSCIGRRSQRWFVSYLFSMVLQLLVGLIFMIRSFRRLPVESDWKLYPAPVPDGWTKTAIRDFQDSATYALLRHLSVMALIGTLLVPVTAGTLVYVILPFTDTTWREARDRGLLPRNSGTGRTDWSAIMHAVSRTAHNIYRLYTPGPSLMKENLLCQDEDQKDT